MPVSGRHYDGVMHDCFDVRAVLDRASEAVADATGDLRAALERAAEATAADLLAGTSGGGAGVADKPGE